MGEVFRVGRLFSNRIALPSVSRITPIAAKIAAVSVKRREL
jgi:hypothetical protein